MTGIVVKSKTFNTNGGYRYRAYQQQVHYRSALSKKFCHFQKKSPHSLITNFKTNFNTMLFEKQYRLKIYIDSWNYSGEVKLQWKRS